MEPGYNNGNTEIDIEAPWYVFGFLLYSYFTGMYLFLLQLLLLLFLFFFEIFHWNSDLKD